MEDYERDRRQQLHQQRRAEKTGAMVRPPKTEHQLVLEESENEAEIDMLTDRRSRLWSRLSSPVGETERQNLAYDVQGATRGLEIAFAAKRRLAVARELLSGKLFVTAHPF